MQDDWDGIVETKRTSWAARLGNSLVGALIGIGLVLGSWVLLYWNEGRAVDAATALEFGASVLVETDADADPAALDGKLVHLIGKARTDRPAADPQFDVSAPDLLVLRRQVEMFQWQETSRSESETSLGGGQTTRTTYSYHKGWSEAEISSADFHRPENHENPSMPLHGTTVQAEEAKVGAFVLGQRVLDKLDDFQPFMPQSGSLDAFGFRRSGQEFYAGDDPMHPRIGDLKMRFWAVRGQVVSVVAGVSDGRLEPFRGKKGYAVALIERNRREASEMFDQARQDEAALTWVLRVVGAVMMLIGFSMAAAPLAVAVSVLPFLAPIVSAGTFLVALILTIPLTLTIIALAWLAHRPLLSLALLALAGAVAVLAVRYKRGRLSAVQA